MKVITDYDYDYDYFAFGNYDYDCDYLKSCNRLQSITITDYDYPMPDHDISTIWYILKRHLKN